MITMPGSRHSVLFLYLINIRVVNGNRQQPSRRYNGTESLMAQEETQTLPEGEKGKKGGSDLGSKDRYSRTLCFGLSMY